MGTNMSNVKNQPTDTQKHYTTDSVTSKDGTTIGYRQFGHGPGVVLLHGTMSSGHNHKQQAEALSDSFTVYVPDRRGRGLSGPYPKDYSIQTEVEDLEALLTKTDTHNVFGLSSGAIILLQAALTLPIIHKAAIFEPPLFNDSSASAILTRYDKEIADGKIAAALITGMKGAKMGPAVFNLIPNWILASLVNRAIASEDKKGQSDYVSMRALAPLLHYDFELVVEKSGKLESFKDIRSEVLLLGGSKSPAYLKSALNDLEKILPNATRIEFPGLGHAASWNSDRGGQPEPVAQALRQFFV